MNHVNNQTSDALTINNKSSNKPDLDVPIPVSESVMVRKEDIWRHSMRHNIRLRIFA